MTNNDTPFSVGDRVRWDDTQSTHSGTIKRINLDDGTALVIGGAYEAVHVPLDSLYTA